MGSPLLLAAAILLASAASAQEPVLPPCDGDITIVRMSVLKPGGTMDAFMAAAQAHQAWYRANGITENEVVVARVLVQDPGTKMWKYSDTEVLSFHVRPPRPPATVNDAAWKAYVQQYRDISDIKAEHVICMPKPKQGAR